METMTQKLLQVESYNQTYDDDQTFYCYSYDV